MIRGPRSEGYGPISRLADFAGDHASGIALTIGGLALNAVGAGVGVGIGHLLAGDTGRDLIRDGAIGAGIVDGGIILGAFMYPLFNHD